MPNATDSFSTRKPLHPIRRHRLESELTLADVASEAGMTEGGLSRIEAAITELPSCAAIQALAVASGGKVSAVDIFRWHYFRATGEVPPTRAPMTGRRDFVWNDEPSDSSAAA